MFMLLLAIINRVSFGQDSKTINESLTSRPQKFSHACRTCTLDIVFAILSSESLLQIVYFSVQPALKMSIFHLKNSKLGTTNQLHSVSY